VKAVTILFGNLASKQSSWCLAEGIKLYHSSLRFKPSDNSALGAVMRAPVYCYVLSL